MPPLSGLGFPGQQDFRSVFARRYRQHDKGDGRIVCDHWGDHAQAQDGSYRGAPTKSVWR